MGKIIPIIIIGVAVYFWLKSRRSAASVSSAQDPGGGDGRGPAGRGDG
ncbi:hypothetical protein [Streptomyces purpureus]|uniref:Uncharacterized protein n=1 Tax=Streptomyces purpureus TaxID=1951 RepID=A0A918HBU2_9ACTN|nr:hypothetical protein [Streptomyces purpureus]GGT53054.1 hypothetical protein GCM10014713_53790 [Streptomyces purpureus]